MDENIKIRNLDYPEIVECTEIEDENDPNAADKYTIYLAVVEPNLKEVAQEMMNQGLIQTYPEVVNIFEMSEITEIATEIMKLSGVLGNKKVTVVEEFKKLISRDGETYFLHFYLQKGITPEYILNLSLEERLFYFASMETAIEERRKLFAFEGNGGASDK